MRKCAKIMKMSCQNEVLMCAIIFLENEKKAKQNCKSETNCSSVGIMSSFFLITPYYPHIINYSWWDLVFTVLCSGKLLRCCN